MVRKVFINGRRGSIDRIHRLKDEYKNDPYVYEKLLFLEDVMSGEEVKSIMQKRGKSAQTGYNWLKQWNENGIEGLKRKKGSGKERKLPKEKLPELRQKIIDNELKNGKHIQKFIEKEYGVHYSERSISRLMKEMKFGYGKPYRIYNESPEDAEEQLMESTEDISLDEFIVVFGDQCAIEKSANNVRLYYPLEEKNTYPASPDRGKVNVNGFYAVNGNSQVSFPPNTRTFEMVKEVIKLRMKNTKDISLKKN